MGIRDRPPGDAFGRRTFAALRLARRRSDRDPVARLLSGAEPNRGAVRPRGARVSWGHPDLFVPCLLYTSDAADERSSVDLGGRRIIKKKKQMTNSGRERRYIYNQQTAYYTKRMRICHIISHTSNYETQYMKEVKH